MEHVITAYNVQFFSIVPFVFAMFDKFCKVLFSLFTGLTTDLMEIVPPNRKVLKRLKIWRYQFI